MRIIAEHLRSNPRFSDRVTDRYVRLIYQTSPLHDIGKVAIPDFVLCKPDSLTQRETEIMRQHTVRGAETISAALREYPHADYLIMARDIALSHHERFDGSGYPHGLAGEDIPLCGRIVALADVYDALTSKRVYKDAFSHEVAHAIITKESGKHFDPHVVDAFIAKEQAFIDIRRQYADADRANRDAGTSAAA